MSHIKSKADAIREEVKQYSWKTLREFERVFPCHNERGLIEVYPKEYVENQDSSFPDDSRFFPEYIEVESVEDFWQRWNKFKKLKVFL